MNEILYSLDNQGQWWRREWAAQCDQKVFLLDQCQGVKGHKGVHWSYAPNGSFRWSDNKEFPEHKGYAGMMPPDHESYKTPQEMHKEYYLCHHQDSLVTDPKIIEMLERDETPEEEEATIDRPLSAEQVKIFKEKYPERFE